MNVNCGIQKFKMDCIGKKRGERVKKKKKNCKNEHLEKLLKLKPNSCPGSKAKPVLNLNELHPGDYKIFSPVN